MKAWCVVIALCVIFGLTFASEAMFKASRKCQDEIKLTKKEYDEAMQSRPIKTENEKVKCYFRCILVELEWMDEEGTIKPPPGVKIPEEELEDAVPCLKVNGTDPCDKAFNFFKCDIEEAEKHGHSGR